jgi:hypothetical protein
MFYFNIIFEVVVDLSLMCDLVGYVRRRAGGGNQSCC